MLLIYPLESVGNGRLRSYYQQSLIKSPSFHRLVQKLGVALPSSKAPSNLNAEGMKPQYSFHNWILEPPNTHNLHSSNIAHLQEDLGVAKQAHTLWGSGGDDVTWL